MIYLIRHAESEANISKNIQLDPILSPTGLLQANMKHFVPKPTENYIVWTSTLKRSIETALLMGFTKTIVKPILNEYHGSSQETFQEFRKRVMTVIQELKTQDKDIVIIGHGCFFSVLLSIIASGENCLPKNGKIFQLKNCSTTIIEHIKKKQWCIHTINVE